MSNQDLINQKPTLEQMDFARREAKKTQHMLKLAEAVYDNAKLARDEAKLRLDVLTFDMYHARLAIEREATLPEPPK